MRGKDQTVQVKYQWRYVLACYGPPLLISLILLIPMAHQIKTASDGDHYDRTKLHGQVRPS